MESKANQNQQPETEFPKQSPHKTSVAPLGLCHPRSYRHLLHLLASRSLLPPRIVPSATAPRQWRPPPCPDPPRPAARRPCSRPPAPPRATWPCPGARSPRPSRRHRHRRGRRAASSPLAALRMATAWRRRRRRSPSRKVGPFPLLMPPPVSSRLCIPADLVSLKLSRCFMVVCCRVPSLPERHGHQPDP